MKATINRTGKNGQQWEIKIRLDDEFKNGHQDFSITGRCWEKGKAKNDRNMIHAGACGDTIAELFPKYAIFNRLHLCDYKGIPMYCTSNGFYHLRKGFNSQATGEAFIAEYCKYYRVTREQFLELNKAETETHFTLLLERLGVFQQWENEANEAIKLLEEMTGEKFVNESKRTNYHRPTDEQIAQEEARHKSGYYSDSEKQKRADQKRAEKLAEMDASEIKEIEKIQLEYKVKRAMFDAGEKAFNEYIFYSHKNEVCFNWRTYGGQKMMPEEIQQVREKVVLPDGITIKG